QLIYYGRSQRYRNHFHLTTRKRRTYWRICFFEQIKKRYFVFQGPLDFLCSNNHYLRSFIAFEPFCSKRPTRSNDKIAGQTQCFRFFESKLQQVDPFVAQPLYRSFAHVIRSPRKPDGLDLDATDTSVI